MTKLDIELKKRDAQKIIYKLDTIKDIIGSIDNRLDYMKEEDGTIKDYWDIEFEALEELKEAICNMAYKF